LAASLGLEPTKEVNAGLQKAAGYTEKHTQDSVLSEVIAAWSSLPEPLKAAVLAIIRTVKAGRAKNLPDTCPPMSGGTTNQAETKESET
jgi:hypothetical protein